MTGVISDVACRVTSLRRRGAAPGQRRSEGGAEGAGRTGRHLRVAANGRKLFSKIHLKIIQIVISYVFACNKNKALYSCSAYLSSVSSGLWLRPVRFCWYFANFGYLSVNSPELFSVSFTLLILSQHDGDDVIVTYC